MRASERIHREGTKDTKRIPFFIPPLHLRAFA